MKDFFLGSQMHFQSFVSTFVPPIIQIFKNNIAYLPYVVSSTVIIYHLANKVGHENLFQY